MQAGQRFRGAHPDAYGQGSVKRGRRRPALLAPPTHPGLSQTQLRRPILHPWLPGELRTLRAVGMAVPPAAQALGCSQGGRTQPHRPAWGGWGAGQGIGVSVSLAVKKGWGTPLPQRASGRSAAPGARVARTPGEGSAPLSCAWELAPPPVPQRTVQRRGRQRRGPQRGAVPLRPAIPTSSGPAPVQSSRFGHTCHCLPRARGPKPCGEGPPCRRL